MTRKLCKVAKNQVIAPGHHVLTLESSIGNGFDPGQFVQLGIEPTFLPRPFSILSADDCHLSILSKVVGVGTRRLFECTVGQRVWVLGPLGKGFRSYSSPDKAIIVGGGVGIPPVYALAVRLSVAGTVPTIIVGARTSDQLLLTSDLNAIGGKLHVMTDDGSAGGCGTVIDRLKELLHTDSHNCCVYACGPHPMLFAVASLCYSRGASCQVAVEANMACGFSVCQGCAVSNSKGGYDLVCRDGPVFDAGRLSWSEERQA